MSPENVEIPTPNTWIYFTPKNSNTYNSSNLRGIQWVDPDNADDEDIEYEFGKLLVRFKNTGVYVYDLPWKIFNELAVRGFLDTMDDYSLTTGKWYSSKFEQTVKDFYRREGVDYSEPLYKDTTYDG